MRDGPAVSVVMSVYNGERYLAEAVDSILTQSLADFELVVVDDGSTDGTAEILAGYADPRLRVVSPGRLGRAGALNAGIEKAKAPLIALMDADDVSLPTRLELQKRFLDEHPSVGLAGTWYTAVSETGEPLYTKTTLLRDADLRRRFLLGVPIAGPTTIMRREVIERVGTFRAAFVPSEDADLWRRIVFEFEVANIPEVLYLYRVHPRSASHVQSDAQERHRVAIVNDMWRQLCFPSYGVGDVRAARRYYASLPTPLAGQLEQEYLAHEAALGRALLARHRFQASASVFAALMLDAPSHLPLAGRFVRTARKLRRRPQTVA